MASEPYEILVGVGTLWIAPAKYAKPTTVDTAPTGSWVDLGDTDEGVTITKTQNIEMLTTDQRTGNVKAVRTEEGVMIETNLAEATLEALAYVINGTVTDTPPNTGVIGKRELKLRYGADVTQWALLFRGSSPYGNFAGEFYVPVGVFTDDIGMEFTKDGKTLIPVKFEALEDYNAAAADRFGIITYKDAVAT